MSTNLWLEVLLKAIRSALAITTGVIIGVLLLLALMRHAQAQDVYWDEFNFTPIPVYVADWRLYHAWEAIDMDAVRRHQCREAISQYHASIVVLQMFLAEGRDLMEVYGDNIRARYKDVEEACNAD
jgi:hypothetical protein